MNGQRPNRNQPPEIIGKIIGGGVGLVFAGIGITVIAFLWGTPFNEFGSPPLFFRIFGSFIAIAFVIVGGGMFLGIVMGGKSLKNISQSSVDHTEQDPSPDNDQTPDAPGSYTCPRCGAPLAKGVDVSPHGDTKCAYCNAWFNIH